MKLSRSPPSLRSSLELLKVQDLKDVLTALGLIKVGRKQDLIHRIANYCNEDELSRTVRVSQLVQNVLGVRVAASAPPAPPQPVVPPPSQQPQTVSSGPAANQPGMPAAGPVRCICNQASMHMAAYARCGECGCLQHRACVSLHPIHDATAAAKHVCEVCRLRDVDPSVEVVGEPRRLSLVLHHSAQMATTNRRVQGALRLTGEELALLASPGSRVELRMYVLELRPPGPFHRWPVGLAVSINGAEVEIKLPPPTWDHNTGRYKVRPVDEVCVLSDQRELRWSSANVLVASAVVQTSSVLCVQLVRRLSADQISAQIMSRASPPADPAYTLEAARARLLRKCFPEQHDDDDLVQTAVNLTLRCPLSLMRISRPVRALECTHTECFDLHAHVNTQLASKCQRWSCPLCGKSARPRELRLDLFVQSILEASAKQQYTEVELQDDGSFKPPRAHTADAPRVKRQRQGAAGGSGSAGAGPTAAVVLDLVDDSDEPPAQPAAGAGASLAAAAPVAPAPPPAVGGSSGCSGGAGPSGGARPALTQQDMARVLQDACAMAAVTQTSSSQRSDSAETHRAYTHIRDLFLSLEEDPTSPDALAFAHEQALTLLGQQPTPLHPTPPQQPQPQPQQPKAPVPQQPKAPAPAASASASPSSLALAWSLPPLPSGVLAGAAGAALNALLVSAATGAPPRLAQLPRQQPPPTWGPGTAAENPICLD